MVLNNQQLKQLLRKFSEASHSQQLPAQVGLRHLDLASSISGRIQVVGRPEDQNLWPQAKPQPASGLRTRRSSLRPQADLRRSNLRTVQSRRKDFDVGFGLATG